MTRKQIRLYEAERKKKELWAAIKVAAPSKSDVRAMRTYAKQVRTGRVPKMRF